MRTSNNVRDVNSVLTLILFLLSSEFITSNALVYPLGDGRCNWLDLAVIFPVRAPIPQIFVKLATRLLRAMRIVTPSTTPVKRVSVRLNFITVPLVSVLVLLATSAFDGEIVRRGVIGADGIKPLDILALFISLVSTISLDNIPERRFHSFTGLYLYFFRFYRTPPFLRTLGSPERWLFRKKIVLLPVHFLPTLWGYCW